MKNSLLLYLFLFFGSTGAFSQVNGSPVPLGTPFQDFQSSAEVHLVGLASTGDQLPFWMYSNQRGRIYENTNLSGWITGRTRTSLGEYAFLEAGAGLLLRDDAPNEITDDELYLHLETQWLHITLGRKHRPVLYNGLSASNENILWSLNARPLHGLQIGTNEPVFLKGERGLGFEASWSEFLLGEDRYLEDAQLHRKSFHLLYRTNTDLQVRIGMQHFAHYGGATADGTVPNNTQSYWKAVSFDHPSQHHLSSYEINISQDFLDYRLEFLYNHIAVDRSGRVLNNLPDGRYGIFYERRDKDRWINSVIYELYYTHDQDYTSETWPGDDYFNHHVYRSGWAYQDKILGAPFFTYDREAERVTNNKFTAHHIGIGGQYTTPFKTYPYRFLVSYAMNEGTYDNRFQRNQDVFSTYLDTRVFSSGVDINLQIGTEFNSHSSPLFGAGVHLMYSL